jgi:phosphotriesterase-related protein
MSQNKIKNFSISTENSFGKIVDAHIHIWLEIIQSSYNIISDMNNYDFINNELLRFKTCGGGSLIDCTPYGCGRDGNILKKLCMETGVNIVAVTGFHKKEYYNTKTSAWDLDTKEAEDFFVDEINNCLEECREYYSDIRAGVIKIAFNGELEGQYLNLTNAAINASKKTNTQILIHTDKGLNVEYLTDFLEDNGINPKKVMLNHKDKRNDAGLHIELADRGYYLEYDTFLRPKYNPEKNPWPLIGKMVETGFEDSIIVGSDIYGLEMWRTVSQNGGLSNFFNSIIFKLKELKIPEIAIDKIIGGNAGKFLNL